MNRALLILLAGIALAVLGYSSVYLGCTAGHASLEQRGSPELAWLKEEFHLSDAELSRISGLHEAYFAGCAERCRQIDSKNQELARLLATNNTVTVDIERLLMESAQLRAECQKTMLQHFYDVSRTMPPKQGKRYLDWVQQQTILPDTMSSMHR